MPAESFTGDAQTCSSQAPVIQITEAVVARGGNEIQTLARAEPVRGALEASHKEACECAILPTAPLLRR